MSRMISLRKRTQIANANSNMLIWVAAVSALLGFAIVTVIFLFQILMFNERVLSEKSKTAATLKINNDNIAEVESSVRVLNTNAALKSVVGGTDDFSTLRVVLDALPSDANSLALGASIQNRLLTGIPGLSVNLLQVDPVVGSESLIDGSSVVDASLYGDVVPQNEITFRFSVSAPADNKNALKQVLLNLEKSIRTIDVTSLKIESQGESLVMNVQARAFYEPAKVMQLTDKVVK